MRIDDKTVAVIAEHGVLEDGAYPILLSISDIQRLALDLQEVRLELSKVKEELKETKARLIAMREYPSPWGV